MNKDKIFIEKARQVHGDKYDYSKVVYIKSSQKVILICPKHGEFLQTPSNHLKGKGCKLCANEKISKIKKYSLEDFIQKANIIHNFKYDYSKVVAFKDRIDKVIIKCPVHGDFVQSVASHLAGSGCPECGKISIRQKQVLSIETFIEKARQIHDVLYDYSLVNYINVRTDVEIVCSKHGSFWQKPMVHLRGAGCPKCANYKKSKRKLSNTSNFIMKAKDIHGDFYDYSKVEYISAISNVIIGCPKHGDFYMTPHSHLSGCGCQKCARENTILAKRMSKETFIRLANEIHNNKFDYSEVQYNRIIDDIIIICSEHGKFKQRAAHHLNGIGCPRCSQSHLEREIMNFLQINNIRFESQKHFDWLGNLSIDFYLCDYKIAIECQGGQHFKPIEFFGGMNTYLYQVERDKRKFNLCKEHNIEVLYYTNKESLKGLSEKPKDVIVGIEVLEEILSMKINNES